MDTVSTSCVRCSRTLSIEGAPSQLLEILCGHCGAKQVQVLYPAGYLEVDDTPTGDAVEGGATCYFHETSDAINLCDDCGRFLCGVCTLPIPLPANCPPDFPERLCPSCFENRVIHEQKHQHWDLFRTNYPRYDVIAGLFVLVPLIIFPLLMLSLFTLPVAVYILLRYWRLNRTPVKHFRGSMVTTLIAALLGIAVWIVILVLSAAEGF